MKKEYYQLTNEETLKEVESKIEGLTSIEVKKRIEKYGLNKLEEKKKKSNLIKFLEQFKNLMVIILIIAACISFYISFIEGESIFEGMIILVIVLLNAVMGFVQELKADKAIDSLKKLFITDVKVRRNNKITEINVEELTIGDILILEAGDYITADARILKSSSLSVEEASLTGESGSVNKNPEVINDKVIISDRKNMIYSGSSIAYGKCEAVVVSVGMKTELGKIAQSLTEEKESSTPLQIKIENISKLLSIIVAVIVVIMMIIGLSSGNEILDVIIIAISLAVAAIPEGLPAVITIILSLGMTKLSKQKAIVRKMSSVETLGSTEIICSDKTGTITKNQMTVRKFFIDNEIVNNPNNDILNKILLLCNDVSREKNKYLGDPTEIALYKYVIDNKFENNLIDKHPRVFDFPFDSNRKLMSSINKDDKENIVLVKGSLDSLLNKCTHYNIANKVSKITNKDKEVIKESEALLANEALRVLGLAYKKIKPKDTYQQEEVENDLIFIGLVGMIDPPRESVKKSIKDCISAGITPVMITGDSLTTAIAIAKEVGIYQENSKAIEGIKLDEISDKELIKTVHEYAVYARVTPNHKLRIIKAWKANNKIVAMTGDGVNDAPALKSSDVGVGMGITGTEVTKNVADIILLDDSFSTIVVAVEEGRNIYENIRKAIAYLITANMAEIIIVFIGMLTGNTIFLPIHLLYINLITDSLPAIALSFEKNDNEIMKRKARDNKNTIFTPFLTSRIAFSSIFKSCLVLTLYFTSSIIFGHSSATTLTFLGLILIEMTFALNNRNLFRSILNKDFFSNKIMNYTMVLLIILQILLFVTPAAGLFELESINLIKVGYVLIFVIISFVVNEVIKKIMYETFKD